ncbi:MAG: ATP-dependent DNA ligase [Methanothrix sp.]|nr:ATP-dependent DNA ligase [Methanothrix sp.]
MTSFLAFAKLCQKVEAVSGSLEKIDLVAAFLADLDEAELSVACSFIMGTLFPPSLDLVIGVGPRILYEALAKACGCPAEQISEMLRATGDPGLVAAGIVEKRRPLGFAAFQEAEPLSIKDVYERFVAIARVSGKRSQDAKVKNLQFLFSQAGSLEARYIARLAIEDMRIGIGEGGVRDAVARAFSKSGADAEKVERAYNLTNDMGQVAVAARRGTLAELSVMINHPIKMMLASLGESISSALGEIGTAAVEWKYDGARVQIHKEGENVAIFSRRMENVTASMPEIVLAARQINAKSAILDGEAVAIGKDGRPKAFQEIMKRFRRKYNVEKLAAQIPLRLFLFDLIYLDGKSVTHLPLSERRALLEKITKQNPASFALLADQVLSDSVEAVEEIYRQALNAGHEGLILKNPSSVYAPGKRGKNWLKIKPVMETLDLVVIGAKWGEGRRASFLGSYRLGCRDTATGNLLDMGYVATGLTDEALAELTSMFRELILLEKGMEVEIKPAVIFEVAYEEIQRSPNYSSGYALRFPRMVAVRDDKSLEEADSLERVVSLYKGQRGRGNSILEATKDDYKDAK